MSRSPAAASRGRLARGSLSPETILDAAERVAADGIDALTIRAVAAELGASTMALYRHFPTKDVLVDALLDRVLARFAPPAGTDDWLHDLTGCAVAHRDLLVRHPWAVVPLISHPTPGLGAVRVGEVVLAALDRGGVRGDAAVAAFSGIIALNYGWSAFATSKDAARFGDGTSAGLGDLLAALPAEQFPHTVRVASAMAGYGSDAHYTWVLGQLLTGLASRAALQP
ncbi:TetR/AcrR family transcriptional regulator [Angustibacter sp. McL0619]|uniref:TetR/AcrR family transcriptional regulator n=1 Tax=Angustibacter sp. McL0619 TaxID=3415676 RepID=UPI003CF3AE24